MDLKELRIKPLRCHRCRKSFYPSLDSKTGKVTEQVKCPFCKNKYWKNKVTRKSVSKKLKK